MLRIHGTCLGGLAGKGSLNRLIGNDRCHLRKEENRPAPLHNESFQDTWLRPCVRKAPWPTNHSLSMNISSWGVYLWYGPKLGASSLGQNAFPRKWPGSELGSAPQIPQCAPLKAESTWLTISARKWLVTVAETSSLQPPNVCMQKIWVFPWFILAQDHQGKL